MRRFLSILLALGLMLSFSLVTAVPALAVPEVWVDDDWATASPGDIVGDGYTFGTDAFATIQDGIDAADLGGATVHVADGHYDEDITLKNGVAVLGAGAGGTTIDGTGLNPVVTAGSVDSTTILDGFTITGGAASYGGGMYNSGASPMVSNCVFTGNSAGSRGGGMYNITNSSPTVVSCIFQGNTSYGTGGAIGCRDHSFPNIGSCLIVGNTAASNGGAIYVSSTSHPTIINNTIAGNTATSNGGAIYVDGSSAVPTVTNNIIANNSATTGSGVYCATPTLSIDYNDVFGNDLVGCTSIDGLTTNPQFVSGSDYHLQGTSPCINAGDTAAVPGWLDTDFEGDPRIWEEVASPRVDIGADEYFDNDPPDTPDNLGPTEYINGDPVDDDTPELTFTQSDPNTYDTVQFTIQIDDDFDFSTPLVDYTSGLLAQGAASFTVGQAEGSGTYTAGSEGQTLPDGDYYWQVMSTDQYGAISGWAVAHGGAVAFHLDTSPSPPPSGGAVGGTVHPIDKAALLLPWFALSATLLLALAASGLILLRRPKP
jgi:parallel beta-helix repeat protein